MKLDRNINGDGHGKYGLINNRKLLKVLADVSADQPIYRKERVADAIAMLENLGILDWGLEGTESEFFVIKLKDKYADDALMGYALSANMDGEGDYARDVEQLAERAGAGSPFCKKPD
jgi:hypothetical protein